jgi:hypothetical protein
MEFIHHSSVDGSEDSGLHGCSFDSSGPFAKVLLQGPEDCSGKWG